MSVQFKTPKVAILLCTYEGQQYLAEQLDSFVAQTHTNWEVWASDDGSEDGTVSTLKAYQQTWPKGRLSIYRGPGRGFAANFLSLTCRADIEADFYAWSDQDDIWEPDKLERAVEWLRSVSAHVPALYCSRTLLVNANNKVIGKSPLFKRPPSFRNALVQSIAGGNTMVMNRAARALLREAGQDVSAVSHDWWAYLVVTGCGGTVFYDKEPTVRYRQHAVNVVGMNSTWSARFKRARMVFQGRFIDWNDFNLAALRLIRHKMHPENVYILDRFSKGRKLRLIPRLIELRRSGIYRHTALGSLGLAIASVLGKL